VKTQPEVFVLGSGKLARDIGGLLLSNNYSVTWLAGSHDYIPPMEKNLKRVLRNIARATSMEHAATLVGRCHLIHEPPPVSPSIVIEATHESLKKKQLVFSKVAGHISTDTLLLSTSSSILPHKIGDGILGLHFFYPSSLTRFAELVVPPDSQKQHVQSAHLFLKNLKIDFLVQSPDNAFACNRLLLPVQAEAIRLLKKGVPAQVVDECSTSTLLSVGQLTLIDAIGFHVVTAAAHNYARVFDDNSSSHAHFLARELQSLIACGMRGSIDRSGFFSKCQTPYPAETTYDSEAIARHLNETFANTCEDFIKDGQCTQAEINRFLKAVFF
jgi:3-hydroxyacyl-CoA dehydrogenase